MAWFNKLGFRKFPLDPRSNPDLIGVDDIEERLSGYIQQGNMCLLSGFTGSGKTSMLQRIQQKPDLKEYRFVFISADGVKKGYLIDDAIKDARSIVEMLSFKKPRNLVILLDESHLANRILTESVKSRWNYTYPDGTKMIQSVIVSQIEPRLGTNFSGSFIDRLGRRIVQMRRLKMEELKQILEGRLDNGTENYINRFTDDGLSFLIKSAEGSVRQLLEYTTAILQKIVAMPNNPFEDEKFEIDKNIVFNILQESGLDTYEKSMLASKGEYEKILKSKKYSEAIEMFESFDTLSAVTLAEKLDKTKQIAQRVLTDLEKKEAIVYSHTDNGEKFYVIAPRLRHLLTKQ